MLPLLYGTTWKSADLISEGGVIGIARCLRVLPAVHRAKGFCCGMLTVLPQIVAPVSGRALCWGGRKAVSLVMTPAHVLRLASTPEPEKLGCAGITEDASLCPG